MTDPARGEVWLVDLGKPFTSEVRGSEQGEKRRCLIVSEDDFNSGPSGLVVVVAISTVDKGIPLHIRIEPPEGGQTEVGFIKPETIRHVAKERLVKKYKRVSFFTLQIVDDRLRDLLRL